MTTSLATALPRVEDQDLLDRVIAEQGGRPGSLLSILEKLQEQHRNKYLPMETLEYVAARTGVPQARRSTASPPSTRSSTSSRRARTR